MKKLNNLAGISAVLLALIYITAFVYFGAFWAYPSDGSSLEKLTYLADQQLPFSLIYLLMYVVFGVLLAFLVVGLYEKLIVTNNPLIKVGSLFGAVWVTLVIASGMISTIGLQQTLGLMESDPEKAFAMWSTLSVITESLGGGNELVGGLWVLLVSFVALKANHFPKLLNYLGLVVGLAGIATVYPASIFTEIFGLSQIVWFICLGICLLKN